MKQEELEKIIDRLSKKVDVLEYNLNNLSIELKTFKYESKKEEHMRS